MEFLISSKASNEYLLNVVNLIELVTSSNRFDHNSKNHHPKSNYTSLSCSLYCSIPYQSPFYLDPTFK
ncbi:hypothetical protein RIF29_04138 [Crotalaria pallida]|uniref:Uncharacterized protein n=1 Tax=Crotalaria pallida TaxID=3830 RepID=A0AAN9J1M8_CROPI